MRKLILAIAVLASPAMAEEKLDFCTEWANAAEAFATQHQRGMSLAKALELNEKMLQPTEQLVAIGQRIVMMIWKRPRWQTEEYQIREIQDMRDNVHLACLEGMS